MATAPSQSEGDINSTPLRAAWQHEHLDEASRALQLGASVAELHGGLCGWLAGGGEDTAAWPARVLADPALPAPALNGPSFARTCVASVFCLSVASRSVRSFSRQLIITPS